MSTNRVVIDRSLNINLERVTVAIQIMGVRSLSFLDDM